MEKRTTDRQETHAGQDGTGLSPGALRTLQAPVFSTLTPSAGICQVVEYAGEVRSWYLGRRATLVAGWPADGQVATRNLEELDLRASLLSADPSICRREALRLVACEAGLRLAVALGMVARAPMTVRTYGHLYRLAQSPAPVLLLGERGAGKTTEALFIHMASPRLPGPFVPVNLAAIPSSLVDSELFGHRAGAFNDASERQGLIASAEHGTLFLDEIGAMEPELGPKLLRVVEAPRVRPVGSDHEREVDVRFVFATNRDLAALAEQGDFPADLLDRISGLAARVPPLRERPEDIPALVESISARFVAQGHVLPARFSSSATATLARHPWPGNVRELRNRIEQLLLSAEGEEIHGPEVERLLGAAAPGDVSGAGAVAMDPGRMSKDEWAQLCLDAEGNASEVERRTGWSRRTLGRRLRALGLANLLQRRCRQ